MTMVAKVFLDTNIILRAFHDTLADHKQVKALFDQLIENETELWISRQVIREYLVQVTHPRTFTEALSNADAIKQLEQITKICRVADETNECTSQLKFLLRTYSTRGKQVHDANIVATMLAYDIDTLATLNLADFKRYEDKITLILPAAEEEIGDE